MKNVVFLSFIKEETEIDQEGDHQDEESGCECELASEGAEDGDCW